MKSTLKAFLIVGFVAFFVIALGSGLMTRLARGASEELLATLEQGDIPNGLGDSAQNLAENLLEFGFPEYRVGRVRLTPQLNAFAEVILQRGNQEAVFNLELEWEGGNWRIIGASESSLEVRILQQQPQLVLNLHGASFLSQGLQFLGTDKLLTVQANRAEWLNRGWQERSSFFASFFEGQPLDLIVGMEDLELFTYGDSIAAAVAKEPFVPDVIRVNISNTGHMGIYHDTVVLKSVAGWQVIEAVTGQTLTLLPGTVNLQPSEKGIMLTSAQGQEHFLNRLVFTQESDSRLELSSITRSGQAPEYYGTMEVANFDGQLIVVNELPLERYLYSVVPSEMPASFGPRALEVQAIVARTYALRNLLASGWRSTSAHVVDSVLSQVYNNIPENIVSINAVNATAGEIVTGDGKPVDVRFFSTSSGYTANSHEVWPNTNTTNKALIRPGVNPPPD